MGTLTLAAGATDDAAAWSLLAIALAVAKGSPTYALYAIVGGILFAVATLTVGRSPLGAFARRFERDGHLTSEVFAGVLIALLVGAYITDAIGIYAVFGAFLVGAAMPRGPFAETLRDRISPVSGALFLPFFFVSSGLNTRLDSLSGAGPWLVAGFILVAAVLGKGAACAVAARLAGESWRDACTIGTLMNARGLMELIILNIGLSQGIIAPTLFTIMVLMAIVTTLMTSPIFLLATRPHRDPVPARASVGA